MSGHWLAVELDVARWNEDKALLPDFSSPTMLKSVLDQVAWLSAGKPCPMEWRPYTERWCKYEHDVRPIGPGGADICRSFPIGSLPIICL